MKLWANSRGLPGFVGPLALSLAACAALVGASQNVSAGVTAKLPVQVSAAAAGKLYGNLADQVKKDAPDAKVRVIVHMKDQVDLSRWSASDRAGAIRALEAKASTSQAQVRAFLTGSKDAPNINVYENYWIFNGFAVEAPASVVAALADRPDVAYILEDGIITLPSDPGPMQGVVTAPDNSTSNWNIYQVNAPQTWALGYDGTGRVVANQDTGVDGAHQALSSRWLGVQPGHSAADSWLDPFGISPNFPTATGNHGTHTMGTITGYYGDSTGPNEIGQAKGADWIACRIYDSTGKGPFSYIHACFQFMLDPDGNPATNDQPDAVGNSWGDTSSYQFPDLEWYQDVQAWGVAGIIPVFSNGNDGSGASTVGAPGSYPISIGVGAVDINRTIASFSSRGPAPNLAPWNDPNNWERSDWNLIKPEVVAPGVNVRSSLPGNAYGNLSGTSMASPHVTGLAAMLRQIRPDLTVNEFYNIIIDTAYFTPTMGTRPNNTYGWGEIDDLAAATYVQDAGAISGTITDGSCNLPISNVDVRVYDETAGSRALGVGIRKLYSASDGGYRTILAAGTYSVTVSAPGYYGTMFTVNVTSSTTTTHPIVLNKMATGTVSGNVQNAGGPVLGATVAVSGLSNIQTTTDANGNYTLTNVPAGTFTIVASDCGCTSQSANVTVSYAGAVTQNFTLPAPTTLLSDDFESGTLSNWTVTGGSNTTAIWNNSTQRAVSGTHAARASIPGQPTYTGAADTYMTTAATYDASAADKLWLSFNLYDSAESEYDITRVQLSLDGGATWSTANTVYGEASPVHGWQSICLDITQFKSATMQVRFWFHSDSSNWNNEVFEGPSVDDVVFSYSAPSGGTPIPAATPTLGATIPCSPLTPTPTAGMPTSTATTGVATATATVTAAASSTPSAGSPTATAVATACTIQFADVPPSADPSSFYPYVTCLACKGIISGYACGGTGEPCNAQNQPYFRPSASISRGQISKMVALSANLSFDPGPQRYEDVPVGSPFFTYVGQLSSLGYMGGYTCGQAPDEPCIAPANRPYFRPSSNASRGQMAKIVSNAAQFGESHTEVSFTDVQTDSPFYIWVQRLYSRGVISGYPCGSAGEPCGAQHLPYFRPNNSVTRAQASKIVSNTFFPHCVTVPARP